MRWIIGDGRARDLCLTRPKINAEEALRIGLISEVIPESKVLDRAIELTMTILEAPQETLEFTKRYLIGNAGKSFEESFRVEHDEAFYEFLIEQRKKAQ